jgi:hypothetical protein
MMGFGLFDSSPPTSNWTKDSLFRLIGRLNPGDLIDGHALDAPMTALQVIKKANFFRQREGKPLIPLDENNPAASFAQPLTFDDIAHVAASNEFGPAFGICQRRHTSGTGDNTIPIEPRKEGQEYKETLTLKADGVNKVIWSREYLVQNGQDAVMNQRILDDKNTSVDKSFTVGDYANAVVENMGGRDDGTGNTVVQPNAFRSYLTSPVFGGFYSK